MLCGSLEKLRRELRRCSGQLGLSSLGHTSQCYVYADLYSIHGKYAVADSERGVFRLGANNWDYWQCTHNAAIQTPGRASCQLHIGSLPTLHGTAHATLHLANSFGRHIELHTSDLPWIALECTDSRYSLLTGFSRGIALVPQVLDLLSFIKALVACPVLQPLISRAT